MLKTFGFTHQKRNLYCLNLMQCLHLVRVSPRHLLRLLHHNTSENMTAALETSVLHKTKGSRLIILCHSSTLRAQCPQGSARILLDYKLFSCAGTQPEICYSSGQPAGSADSDQESANSCDTQMTLLKYWKGFPSSSRECLGTLLHPYKVARVVNNSQTGRHLASSSVSGTRVSYKHSSCCLAVGHHHIPARHQNRERLALVCALLIPAPTT